ncbi:MAG: hypothetical protein ACTSV1_03510 [Alphaproteobacteria bacterium]
MMNELTTSHTADVFWMGSFHGVLSLAILVLLVVVAAMVFRTLWPGNSN